MGGEQITFLAATCLSNLYEYHFLLMLIICFFLIGVAAFKFQYFDLVFKKLIELKTEQSTHLITLERHPYIVFS